MSNNLKHVNYERFKTLYYVGLTGSMTQAGEAMCLCQIDSGKTHPNAVMPESLESQG